MEIKENQLDRNINENGDEEYQPSESENESENELEQWFPKCAPRRSRAPREVIRGAARRS